MKHVTDAERVDAHVDELILGQTNAARRLVGVARLGTLDADRIGEVALDARELLVDLREWRERAIDGGPHVLVKAVVARLHAQIGIVSDDAGRREHVAVAARLRQ